MGVITSLLDTDLYKLTMQACVHKHFADANASYLLHNRSTDMHLTAEAVEWIRKEVLSWSELEFTEEEIQWLEKAVPYLPKAYIEFLKGFKLDPAKEVNIKFDPSAEKDLVITVQGKWEVTILYEIPILSTVSEAYFRFVDTDWDIHSPDQRTLAAQKARELIKNDCPFSEFGTRRRRSKLVQQLVLEGIIDGSNGSDLFVGTSNVMFAKQFGLKPIGTVAHELMMGVAAYTQDYPDANRRSMEVWIDTVGKANAGYSLTDTFGTSNFLKAFKPPYSDIYSGVRQDSGSPLDYTEEISRHLYQTLGLPRNSKRIVYSDSLNIERCEQYRDAAVKHGLIPAFGVGTFFTNDFVKKSDPSKKSKPLNIVMKIASVNGNLAVKLSDNISKNTGDPQEVIRVKKILGYVEGGDKIDEANRWT